LDIGLIVEKGLRDDSFLFGRDFDYFDEDGRAFWVRLLVRGLLADGHTIQLIRRRESIFECTLDLLIWFDRPADMVCDLGPHSKHVLFQLESPVIQRVPQDDFINRCALVFSNDPALLEHPRAVEFFFPINIPFYTKTIARTEPVNSCSLEFICVAGDKASKSTDAYSIRREILKIMADTLSVELYGRGWGCRRWGSWWIDKLNEKLGWIPGGLSEIWRGEVRSKRELASKARFVAVFENSYGVCDWYFSEKLPESVFMSSLPVFFGSKRAAQKLGFLGVIYAEDFISVRACLDYCVQMNELERIDRLKLFRESFNNLSELLDAHKVTKNIRILLKQLND
jgi:hypothetical protein